MKSIISIPKNHEKNVWKHNVFRKPALFRRGYLLVWILHLRSAILRFRVGLGGHLKKCTSFWGGAKGPKGYQNETREALKAKRELIKIVEKTVCFTWFSQHGGPRTLPRRRINIFFGHLKFMKQIRCEKDVPGIPPGTPVDASKEAKEIQKGVRGGLTFLQVL